MTRNLLIWLVLTLTCASVARGQSSPDPWRRTRNGWERIDTWTFVSPHQVQPAQRLNPLLVAGAMALLSIGALVALPAKSTRRTGF